MKNNEKIDYIVNKVINCRDMCGNEKQAFIDGCHDMKVRPTIRNLSLIMSYVEQDWAKYQIEAGVTNPIHPDERISVYKDINSGS